MALGRLLNMNSSAVSCGREDDFFTESIRYRVTPLAMMGIENKTAPMNPTTEKPIAATGIQNRFIATFRASRQYNASQTLAMH